MLEDGKVPSDATSDAAKLVSSQRPKVDIQAMSSEKLFYAVSI